MTSEQQLIAKAKQLDRAALAEIYELYSDDLYRYAMRKVQNRQVAEECVAETFSRFLATLRRGGGPRDHLRAYLYRAAHNWLTDYYRERVPEDVEMELLVDDKETGVMGDGVDVAKRKARVLWALDKLTPDQQKVIYLKFYEGWRNREIARVIEKPESSVKSLQHRAIASLRRLLFTATESEVA